MEPMPSFGLLRSHPLGAVSANPLENHLKVLQGHAEFVKRGLNESSFYFFVSEVKKVFDLIPQNDRFFVAYGPLVDLTQTLTEYLNNAESHIQALILPEAEYSAIVRDLMIPLNKLIDMTGTLPRIEIVGLIFKIVGLYPQHQKTIAEIIGQCLGIDSTWNKTVCTALYNAYWRLPSPLEEQYEHFAVYVNDRAFLFGQGSVSFVISYALFHMQQNSETQTILLDHLFIQMSDVNPMAEVKAKRQMRAEDQKVLAELLGSPQMINLPLEHAIFYCKVFCEHFKMPADSIYVVCMYLVDSAKRSVNYFPTVREFHKLVKFLNNKNLGLNIESFIEAEKGNLEYLFKKGVQFKGNEFNARRIIEGKTAKLFRKIIAGSEVFCATFSLDQKMCLDYLKVHLFAGFCGSLNKIFSEQLQSPTLHRMVQTKAVFEQRMQTVVNFIQGLLPSLRPLHPEVERIQGPRIKQKFALLNGRLITIGSKVYELKISLEGVSLSVK